MKNVIAVLLLLVGLVFLGVGYSASFRIDSRISQRHWEHDMRSPRTGGSQQPNEVLTETVERQDCETRGAIQYCTGWLMIAVAGIVFSLGRDKEEFVPPTT